MEYNEIIYLISKTITEDTIGNIIETETNRKKVYAKTQSVRTNEFYNATMAGLTPNIEFVIKKLNYSGEDELEWNNQLYSIIRSVDPKNKFDIVLVCSKKIGNNG